MIPGNNSTARRAKACFIVVPNAKFTAERPGFEASEGEIPENLL
jgi:hypothetical protein